MMHDLHWIWHANCTFNLARKLKRTENVLNGNEMRETEMEVSPIVLCKTKKIQKQIAMREIEA